jgi:hypothetical protein
MVEVKGLVEVFFQKRYLEQPQRTETLIWGDGRAFENLSSTIVLGAEATVGSEMIDNTQRPNAEVPMKPIILLEYGVPSRGST